MSVLQQIVAQKRVDLAARQSRTPIESLRERATPTDRSLIDSLRRPGLRFILECKSKSPSEGSLRPTYDPAAIADVYRGFADGISVLTDAPYFGGDLEHIRTVRVFATQPILCKDFVIDPYQIWEARAAGADAILLMLSVLNDAEYRRCAVEADRLRMDVLTEVHDEQELYRALSLDARLIGINNRDLHTLKIDLATTRRLAPKIDNKRVVVCESGIHSRADVDNLAEFVDAFLVGSHLMKAQRLDLAVRELIHGAVKVCGLTTPEQIQISYLAGASWGGLIFASESKRCVSVEQARRMAHDSPLRLVGVFVNESIDHIVRLASELQLSAVQLHGDETADMTSALRTKLAPSCEVWKAVCIKDSIPRFDINVDRMLLDTYADAERGGTGRSFDWSLLDGHPEKSRIVLSGGICPENVVDAHRLGCGLLDVNSGVETAPGVKDETLLRRLFAALRGV